jgi:flagellar biosynthetic protein FliQ
MMQDFSFMVNLVSSSIIEMMMLSAPALIVGMVVGLIISIFQATTSIQEQTLTFVPKIAAILLSIILLGPWMFNSMAQFTINLFNSIARF